MSKTNEHRPVVDTTSSLVVDREGVLTVVFYTKDGKEVLFQRDKERGHVKKVTPLQVEVISHGEARNIAIKLLPNPILENDAYHTVRVVEAAPSPAPKTVKSSGSQAKLRPAWLRNDLAHAHDLALRTHVDD